MADTYILKTNNLGGSPFVLDVDADLDNMSVKVESIAPLLIDVTDLPTIKFDPIDSNINVTNIPKIVIEADTNSSLDVAIKEIPDIRAHVPSHYNLGVSIFGIEVLNFSLCGESQMITEKYVPTRMEICR